MNAVVDLTEVYKGSAAGIQRGIAIADQQYVVVRDEIKAVDTITTIRWTLLTPATVIITGMNTAELTKNGKKMLLRVDEPHNIVMKTWPTDPPPHEFDAPNPGTTLVGFEIVLPAKSSASFTVMLIPEKAVHNATKKIPALREWNH